LGVITISREFGSGGEALAQLVADKLGFYLIDHQEIATALERYGVSGYPKIQEENEEVDKYLQVLDSYLKQLVSEYNVVILGRGAHFFLSGYSPSLRVRVVSNWDQRVKRAIKEYGLGKQAAIKLVQEQDDKKDHYFREVFKQDWRDVKAYDMVINTGAMVMEKTAKIIVSAYRIQEEGQVAEHVVHSETSPKDIPSSVRDTQFMHPSEEDIAKLLDFYRLRWEYEPRTFVLEWDNEGNIQEAFSPDFYLPDYDLYLEITTQKQQLGWKKNKKIRRLKELYPQINIKLINKKGFQSLLQKFGLDQ